jgi:hypothetical protein
VPDILPRRRVLLASAAALPVLLGTAGCRSSDVFTGPDPLAGPPRPAPDVITLQAVIAAEDAMVQLYQAAIGGDRAAARAHGLEPLLAEHQQHLMRLRARLIVPPGASASAPASPGASVSPSASPVPRRVTIARLRAAERASATDLVRRLGSAEPALAQLFASIAASDATHVAALGG